jgi:hypothetical protein
MMLGVANDVDADTTGEFVWFFSEPEATVAGTSIDLSSDIFLALQVR